MTFNERLSELLEEKYLSAEALAKQIGLSGSIVSRWRRKGNVSPKLEHLLRVAEFFNCSLNFLCGRTEDENVFNKAAAPKFSERLRQLIKESKLPVSRVSKDSNLSRYNFYDWFNGAAPLSSSLCILADYFDCSIDYLVGLED